jgi:protein-S-isoprenylcysteine O-methyltransferase Ste14
VPWWLTRWRPGEPWLAALPLRILGAALIAAGTGVLLHAFARFVVEGAGTPVPVAPTARLVVGGLYRHVRNPMYVAVVAVVAGEALLLARPVLLAWAAVMLGVFAAFVAGYEEPTLRTRYGAAYESYRRAVPGWWPRWRPWRGDGA